MKLLKYIYPIILALAVVLLIITALSSFKQEVIVQPRLKKEANTKLMHLNKWDFFIYQKMGI